MSSPTDPIAHRNLPLALLRARESVLANFRPVLNAAGLTEQQWRVIRALAEAGPLEPRELVAACRISSPSLAGVLARMDDLGLVRRERHAGDQRRVRVSLTPRSRGLLARMAPRVDAIYRMLEVRLGASEMAALYGALDRLVAMLGTEEPAAD